MTETLKRRTSPTNAALIDLITSYDYDMLDRVVKVTDALGNEALNTYASNGRLLLLNVTHRYKKPDGTFDESSVVTRTFDDADRIKTVADSWGNTSTYQYDPAGNVIAVTDAADHTTRFEYDAMNRKTAIIDATGYRTETKYTLRGDVVSITNANKETVQFETDALGRKTAVIDPRGFRSEFVYDENGNLVCMIDANAQAGLQPKNTLGCSESRTYDELNRVIKITDAANSETFFTYDLAGNRLTVKDAELKTHNFTYDDLGRLASETDHVGKVTSYKPDEAGNVYETTNRLAETTRITYDKGNRATKVDYLKDGTAETFGYDPAGTLASAVNGSVTYRFTWDYLNRLLTKTDSRGKNLAFTYDGVGNVLTKTTYQGSTTSYTYNAANRLVMLRNPDYLQVDYQYDPAGRLLSRVTSAGARTTSQYDANGWQTRLTQYDAANVLISDTSYTRDRAGNILTQTDAAGTTTYVYDPLYRLKTADYPGTANDELFTYDKVGNRKTSTKSSLTQNANTRYYNYTTGTNRLLDIRIGSTTGTVESGFTNDFEGRLTAQTGTGAKTFTWDAKSRVKTLTKSGATETYTYDPMDYRIGRSGGALGSLDYFLEGEHLESIYSGANLQAKYLRGSSIDELVAGYLYDTDAKLKPYLFHHDNVTSTTAVSGHNGGTIQSTTFGAFGNTQSSTGASPNRLKYTGREDDNTGLYYYRARYYDPAIGRFVSEDPLGFEAGINFYQYVGANPVNGNDPSGLDTKITIGYTKTIAPGLSHQLVILTDTVTGKQYATRAGPECSGGCLKGLGAGQITAVSDTFDANFKYDPPKSVYTTQEVGVIKRDFNDSVNNAINFRNTTNQNQISYWPLGPNSNSYATTFVESLTGTRPAPTVTAPGADMGRPSSNLNYSPSPIINTGGASGSWGSGATGSWSSSSAAGGFLLYPNKSNTNQMQSVYSK